MAKIDYSKRPKGMSKREWEAQQSGGVLNYETGKISYAPSSPYEVTDMGSAKAFINGNQAADIAYKQGDVPIRSSVQSLDTITKDLQKSLLGKTKAPVAPTLETAYTGLRGQYGIDALEQELLDLQKQAQGVKTQYQTNKTAEQGKPVAMNVIEGRVSEQAQNANDQLTLINDRISTITNELNTKYNVINSIMDFKKTDYETAKGEYDSRFNQALQVVNLARGIREDQQTAVDKVQNSALANLKIIYDNLSSAEGGWQTMSPELQATVSKLELQAGLPLGTFRTVSGKKSGDDLTESDIKTANENTIYQALDVARQGRAQVEGAGWDGFLNPDDWKPLLSKWIQAGGSASEFFEKFGGKTQQNAKTRKTERVSGFINPRDF
jgi:hypothetical protein